MTLTTLRKRSVHRKSWSLLPSPPPPCNAAVMLHTVFEDNAVLVLHVGDLSEGGVCILDRVGGYGENSPSSKRWCRINDAANNADADGNGDDDNNNDDDASSRALRDMGGGCHRRPATSSSSLAASLSFTDHTCGSFLAREMVRYAESNAAFAFVVGLSNENDQTTTGAHPGECILLGLGGW